MSSADLDARLRRIWHASAERTGVLPSEAELAARLRASRPSLREALARLEHEGLIERRAGAGTYVNHRALKVPLRFDQNNEFSDMLEASGYRSDLEVVEAGWIDADDDAAGQVEVEPGSRLWRAVKRWRADDVAAMVAVDLFPTDAAVVDPPDASQGLDIVVEHLTGEVPVWESVWPRADAADRTVAKLLELKVGAPVLVLELQGVSRTGRVVYHATEYHRPRVVEYGFIRTVRSGGRR